MALLILACVLLPPNWPELSATDLVEHLKARTMAGLPHIGVLGMPIEPEKSTAPDEPVDIEEDDYVIPTATEGGESEYPDWKFVPNKLAYHLTIEPVNDAPLTSRVTFHIRLREGCDTDVGKNLKDRPAEYCLTEEELLGAFRKYEVEVKTDSCFKSPSEVEVRKDDIVIEPDKLLIEPIEGGHKTTVEVRDTSDVILYYEENEPRLTRQPYRVRITKQVTKDEAGKVRIAFELRNLSPRKCSRSVIPYRRLVDEKAHKVESEEDCLSRIRQKLPSGGDSLWSEYKPRFFKIEKNESNPEGNRYGYLMEVEVSEAIQSKSFPYAEFDAARTVNAVIDDGQLVRDGGSYKGKLVFRDHCRFLEQVPLMTQGSESTDFFARLGIDDRIAKTFSKDLKFERLYKFQEAAASKIAEAARLDSPISTVLISARTAGGKTEAFLIPILQYCIEQIEKPGTKAIVFYPTKALANDQTSRYIEVLYHLNKRLPRTLTLGLLHGDISKSEPEPGTEDDWDLPLACPACKVGVLKAEGKQTLKCHECGESIHFVKVRNRLEVYSDPPDILISNPDTLIWDLMLKPFNHSIFGRSIQVCQSCLWPYVGKGKKRRCENTECRSQDIRAITPSSPRFIVFDEVHMFKGTFGINCSHFISRLEAIIRRYAKEIHKQDSWKIVRIGSTATISNGLDFSQDFFKAAPSEIALVPLDEKERSSFYALGDFDKSVKRHHVFIMPYAYNTDSTVGRTIHYLQLRAKTGRPPALFRPQYQSWGEFLETITFVNSIRSSNNLIGLTARTTANELPDLTVDGHTTDFDRKQRARIERTFNRGELHAIFATQTLEVGIDFRRIDVVIVNGFPFSFNDYVQRIGRGGRLRDSLVVTVCQNWKPIDHYYYSNAKEALKDPTRHIEPVPITRHNAEALAKHARGAVFDYLMLLPECMDYLNDFRTLKDISAAEPQIVNSCIDCLKVGPAEAAEIQAAVHSFLGDLATGAQNEIAPVQLFKRFHGTINQKYQLTSLRSTDREVTIEVMWGK